MRRHVILVGLPGSGKSTVGPLVAARLAADFRDVDRIIEEREGRSIPELFRARGETWFRQEEHRTVLELVTRGPFVIAPGGGWIAEAGNLEAVAGRSFVVHLETSASAAAERLGGAAGRPLLADDPQARLEQLLAARGPAYGRSDAVVRTDGRTPDSVAREVAELARSMGGW